MCIPLEKLLKQPGVAEDFKNSLMDGIHMAHLVLRKTLTSPGPMLVSSSLNFEEQWKGFTEDLEILTGAKVATCATPLNVYGESLVLAWRLQYGMKWHRYRCGVVIVVVTLKKAFKNDLKS
ncbi:hypothetical protein WN943_015380 [Citrus x changshan-huyou]